MLFHFVLISPFDPWKSKLCTCPKKYSFSPYTGCSHGCIYCYITSYIPNAFHARVKKDVIRRLGKEVRREELKVSYISMANSSDPYTPEEKKERVTRKALKIFQEMEIPVLIVTKSDLVARDIDILSSMKASVSMSITYLNNEKMEKIESNAPSAEKRINAIQKLSESGIPCSVRLDPIIPEVNDKEIEKIVKEVAPYCSHIVSSTLKPRMDAIHRLNKLIPDVMKKIQLQRMGNSYYLPLEKRKELLKRVRDACRQYDISFATCREGFFLAKKTCDGSHLIPG